MSIYTIDETNAQLHISKGNSKLGKGIYSFATLPGNAEHMPTIAGKGQLVNIPGTCSRFCENCAKDGACYAWRDCKLHHNVTAKAWGENTVLLRQHKVWHLIDEFITKKNSKKQTVFTFRINTSGEIEDEWELENWNNLAKKHPEVTFAIYTKNYDALKAFTLRNGGSADNFVINVSEWHGVAKEFLEKYPDKYNIFEYDDSKSKTCDLPEEEKMRLAATQHCPAVTPDGHHAKDAHGNDITCDMCRRCYRKTGKRTAVYAH